MLNTSDSSFSQKLSQSKEVIAYYEEALEDYQFWSKHFHMHFGYFKMGMSPFHLEKMLFQMTEEVFKCFSISEQIPSFQAIDLGCGIGTSASIFAQKYPQSKVWGVTLVQAQIEKAQQIVAPELAQQIEFICANYANTKLPSESIMAAYAIESSCYAAGANKKDLLQEAYRLLQKGGKLVIADGFLKHNKPLPKWLKKVYDKTCKCWALEELGQINAFREAMHEVGFKNIKVRDISWNVAPSVAFVPLITLKFLWKNRFNWKNLSQERRNNIFAPFMTMILGLSRKHFSYYLVEGEKV